ncbi:MAG: hypothetical protein HQL35_02640 [Alphaproteobacteria bacterium]|nr:hypothetical protein [Alphaproteobacteria bacterium]
MKRISMSSTPSILLVDDNEVEASAIRESILSQLGEKPLIYEARTYQGAVEFLEQHHDAGDPIALVVTDYWLAELTNCEGLDLIQYVHGSPKHSEFTRCLLYSAMKQNMNATRRIHALRDVLLWGSIEHGVRDRDDFLPTSPARHDIIKDINDYLRTCSQTHKTSPVPTAKFRLKKTLILVLVAIGVGIGFQFAVSGREISAPLHAAFYSFLCVFVFIGLLQTWIGGGFVTKVLQLTGNIGTTFFK